MERMSNINFLVNSETVKENIESALNYFDLGHEVRPAANKVPLFVNGSLDSITTTKEQIIEWSKPQPNMPYNEIEYIKKLIKYENQSEESLNQQIDNIKKYGYFANGVNILTGYIKRGKFKDNFLNLFDFDNDDPDTVNDFMNGDKIEDTIGKYVYVENHIKPFHRIHILPITDTFKLFGQTNEKTKDNKTGLGIYPEKRWVAVAPSWYKDTQYRYTKVAGSIDLGESKVIKKGSNEHHDLGRRRRHVEYESRNRESYKILSRYFDKKGNRHYGWLDIIGMLFKNTNTGYELIEDYVRKGCKYLNDDQLNDRLECIRTTKERIDKGEPVSGYQGLKEQMDLKDLEELKKLLGVDEEYKKRENKTTVINDDNDKLTKTELQQMVYEKIIQDPEYRFYYFDKNHFYCYNTQTGCYENNATHKLHVLIQDLFGVDCKKNDKNEITQFVIDDKTVNVNIKDMYKFFNQNYKVLNFESGLLDLQNGIHSDHTPDYISIIQFPFKYDPNADCPLFKEYMEFVFPDPKLRKLVYRLIANTFILNNKDPYITICYGDGGRGKGVLFKIIRALHGVNAGATELYRLGSGDNFGKSSVENKTVILDTEIDEFTKKHISALKQLASEDLIHANQKYEIARAIESFCKFFFSCNNFPQIPESEKNEGWYRRVVIIPFKKKIPAEKKDKYLAEKIIKNELSGIFNLLLPYIQEIMKDETSNVFELSVEEQKNRLDLFSDPLHAWIESKCDKHVMQMKEITQVMIDGVEEDILIPIEFNDIYFIKDPAYESYVQFCNDNDISTILSKKQFGIDLKKILKQDLEYLKHNYGVSCEGQKTIEIEQPNGSIKKERPEVWKGIRDKSDKKGYEDIIVRGREEFLEDYRKSKESYENMQIKK